METKKEKLLTLFNELFAGLDVTYQDLNSVMMWPQDSVQGKHVIELEKEHPVLGIWIPEDQPNHIAITAISLMATITDVLCGERLAVEFDTETMRITGWSWYQEQASEA